MNHAVKATKCCSLAVTGANWPVSTRLKIRDMDSQCGFADASIDLMGVLREREVQTAFLPSPQGQRCDAPRDDCSRDGGCRPPASRTRACQAHRPRALRAEHTLRTLVNLGGSWSSTRSARVRQAGEDSSPKRLWQAIRQRSKGSLAPCSPSMARLVDADSSPPESASFFRLRIGGAPSLPQRPASSRSRYAARAERCRRARELREGCRITQGMGKLVARQPACQTFNPSLRCVELRRRRPCRRGTHLDHTVGRCRAIEILSVRSS
jgi:hypothetical protein